MEPEANPEPTLALTPLPSFRIPDYPNAPLLLNQQPLSILSLDDALPQPPNIKQNIIPPELGLATVLYKWHPTALTAFLDLDAWFSLTWTCARCHLVCSNVGCDSWRSS